MRVRVPSSPPKPALGGRLYVSLYHGETLCTTRKEQRGEQGALFPEQLLLIPDAFASSLFSCIYERKGVQCTQQLKAKAPSVAFTTDEADQPNVVAHVEAESTLILPHPRRGRQGCIMEARQIRGLEIASSQPITSEGGVWIVPSQTSSKKYTVNLHI